jgi:hypothetical protein
MKGAETTGRGAALGCGGRMRVTVLFTFGSMDAESLVAATTFGPNKGLRRTRAAGFGAAPVMGATAVAVVANTCVPALRLFCLTWVAVTIPATSELVQATAGGKSAVEAGATMEGGAAAVGVGSDRRGSMAARSHQRVWEGGAGAGGGAGE